MHLSSPGTSSLINSVTGWAANVAFRHMGEYMQFSPPNLEIWKLIYKFLRAKSFLFIILCYMI